jgi:hypothetical protein
MEKEASLDLDPIRSSGLSSPHGVLPMVITTPALAQVLDQTSTLQVQ